MMDQPTHEQDPFAWLAPAEQARLEAFKAYAVNHTRLGEVDGQLTQAILEPAGFAHVLVYGPSGVGKTTVDVLPGLKAGASTPPDGSAVAPQGPPPFLPALNRASGFMLLLVRTRDGSPSRCASGLRN